MPVNQLAANNMIGHLFFILYLASAHLYLKVLGLEVSKAFCWITWIITILYITFGHYSVLMVTIERLMFIREPTKHSQQVSGKGTIVLHVFPWAFSLTYGLVSSLTTVSDVTTTDTGNNSTKVHNTCSFHFRDDKYEHWYKLTMWLIVRILPLALGFLTIITAIFMCCFRKIPRNRRHSYASMGDNMDKDVRDSVICVCIINILSLTVIVVAIFFNPSSGDFPMFLSALYAIQAFLQGCVFVGTLKYARLTLVHVLKQCICNKSDEMDRVTYNSEQGQVEIPIGEA